MRPVSAIYAVQAGLQAADGDDTGIWRTPCSEKGPSGGTFELAHVLEIIGNSCRASWLAGGRWSPLQTTPFTYLFKEVSLWKQ